jgi:hypothetical protein
LDWEVGERGCFCWEAKRQKEKKCQVFWEFVLRQAPADLRD